MKWIGGVILLIVTVILLILAMFMFPWFSTKTTYYPENIDRYCPEYWNDTLGSNVRNWDESTYNLQSYELRTSRPINWSTTSTESSTSSGELIYNSQPSAGGWDGSYYTMKEAGYPVAGFLPGGAEQLMVYNFTYYMVIFGIIMAIVSTVFIVLAGLEKINATIPKVLVGVSIVLVILAPLYFALALPAAIETDSKEYQRVSDPLNLNSTYRRPAEAGGIMGEANELDDSSRKITSTTAFGPGIGWWLMIAAIFTTIVTIGFVSGPGEAASARPKNDKMRRKYHEFDRPYQNEYRRDYDAGYEPPPRRATRDYYDDGYSGRGGPGTYPEEQYDSYSRAGRPGPEPKYQRRPPPPPQYDYGRPAPRPPRQSYDYPPPPPRRPRRPPQPGY